MLFLNQLAQNSYIPFLLSPFPFCSAWKLQWNKSLVKVGNWPSLTKLARAMCTVYWILKTSDFCYVPFIKWGHWDKRESNPQLFCIGFCVLVVSAIWQLETFRPFEEFNEFINFIKHCTVYCIDALWKIYTCVSFWPRS